MLIHSSSIDMHVIYHDKVSPFSNISDKFKYKDQSTRTSSHLDISKA